MSTATTLSAMSPEWQRLEAAGLRREAQRLAMLNLTAEGLARVDRLAAHADRLERAYLEPGECLEDGRGPLSPAERAEMDAVRLGAVPR